jgi:hypothetical protein
MPLVVFSALGVNPDDDEELPLGLAALSWVILGEEAAEE